MSGSEVFVVWVDDVCSTGTGLVEREGRIGAVGFCGPGDVELDAVCRAASDEKDVSTDIESSNIELDEEEATEEPSSSMGCMKALDISFPFAFPFASLLFLILPPLTTDPLDFSTFVAFRAPFALFITGPPSSFDRSFAL